MNEVVVTTMKVVKSPAGEVSWHNQGHKITTFKIILRMDTFCTAFCPRYDLCHKNKLSLNLSVSDAVFSFSSNNPCSCDKRL